MNSLTINHYFIMLRYTMMKRLTQILASILFIVIVLTVYLVFDFALNNAVSNKYLTDKHEHIHNDNTIRKTSSALSLLRIKKIDEPLKHNNDNEHEHIIDQERGTRSLKPKQNYAKPPQFHKSKTGIKINQIKKSIKEQRKRLLTTKITQRKDMKSKTDKTPI